jgi:hypothetical protein
VVLVRRLVLAAALAVLVLAPPAGAWTWPTAGAVVQPFSFDLAHPYAAGQHRGVDVAGDRGSTVIAPAAGVVAFAGSVPSSGLTLTIDTADGYAVTLTHLGSLSSAKGASVAEGDGVGTIGPSGDPEVSGPYVHLGVRVAAQPQGYLDPLSLLPGRVPVPPVLVPLAAPPADTPPDASPAAVAPDPDSAPAAGGMPGDDSRSLGGAAASDPAAADAPTTTDGGSAPAPTPAAAPVAADAPASATVPAPADPAPAVGGPDAVARADAVPAAQPAPPASAAAAPAPPAAPAPAPAPPAAVVSPAAVRAQDTTPAAVTAPAPPDAMSTTDPAPARVEVAPLVAASSGDVPSRGLVGEPPRVVASPAARPRPHRSAAAVSSDAPAAAADTLRRARVARRAATEQPGRATIGMRAGDGVRAQRPPHGAGPNQRKLSRPRSAAPPAAAAHAHPRRAHASYRRGRDAALAAALGAALSMLVGGATAVLALRRRRKAAPIMARNALLRHDADLLRERPAAHRARLHDDRGRHPRATSPPARGRHVLPDGGGRARDEGMACGGAAGAERAGVRRPDRRGMARIAAAVERGHGLLPQDDGRRAQGVRS